MKKLPFFYICIVSLILLIPSCKNNEVTHKLENIKPQSYSIYNFEAIKRISDESDVKSLYENDLMEYIAIPTDQNLDSIRDMASNAYMYQDSYNAFLYYYAKERILKFIWKKNKYRSYCVDSITSKELDSLNIEEGLIKHILYDLENLRIELEKKGMYRYSQ